MELQRDQDRGVPPPGQAPGRISFERLRERTDELELLISGLTLFALLSLPGWLMQRFEASYNQMPFELLVAASMAVPMAVSIAYVLACGFVAHLGVRAYWVGLIGLKAIYPEGVRWTHLPTLGPFGSEQLQARVAPIDSSIARADRVASVLFSANLLGGLSLFWIGLLLILVFFVSALFGVQVGAANRYIQYGISGFFALLLASVVALWLFDAQLAGRSERLRTSSLYRLWVRLLGWLVRLFFPQRLLATLKLTLQSNSRPRLFGLLYLSLVLLAPLLGASYFERSRGFDPFSTQRFLTTKELGDGPFSSYYESQRIARERRRGNPMIPAPVIETAWLPLFLPYQPIRDDFLIELRCPERVAAAPESASDQAAQPPGALSAAVNQCFARLWEVRLNGQEVELGSFVPTERADLGFRGLSGYIDLRGQPMGPQQLDVTWRPRPETEVLDNDMLPAGSQRYAIPFLWSPEAAVEAPSAVSAAGGNADAGD